MISFRIFSNYPPAENCSLHGFHGELNIQNINKQYTSYVAENQLIKWYKWIYLEAAHWLWLSLCLNHLAVMRKSLFLIITWSANSFFRINNHASVATAVHDNYLISDSFEVVDFRVFDFFLKVNRGTFPIYNIINLPSADEQKILNPTTNCLEMSPLLSKASLAFQMVPAINNV